MSLCCRKEFWLKVAGSGARLPGWLSLRSVTAIFAAVTAVEELAPVNLKVLLTILSAHLVLSGSGRTQAVEQDNLALHSASNCAAFACHLRSLSLSFLLSKMGIIISHLTKLLGSFYLMYIE